MNINRGRFFYSTFNVHTPENPIPDTPIVVPTTPPITAPYTLADFGENVINNHSPYDVAHSERCQIIFNAITKNFRGRCTSYQTYKTDEVSDMMVYSGDVLKYSKILKSDLIFTPYVGASYWMNSNYGGFILSVASHYNNDGMGNIQVGSDNNRHDITPNATTFLTNSIAVSARRDTPELFKNSTSEGFGMEFFEDCSPMALDPVYPDRDIEVYFAEVRTSADGYTLYGNRTKDMKTDPYISIGEEITLVNGELIETRVVSQLLENGTIVVQTPFTPYVVTGHIELRTIVNGVDTKIAEVGTEYDGKNLTAHNIKTTNFTTSLTVGQEVTLIYPDLHTETKIVEKVNSYDVITLTTAATNYQIPGIYVRYNGTIGQYMWGQAESWAVPLVAGKLKVIKMTTNADWNTVRMAARTTAKRNTTGIPEIDNAN